MLVLELELYNHQDAFVRKDARLNQPSAQGEAELAETRRNKQQQLLERDLGCKKSRAQEPWRAIPQSYLPNQCTFRSVTVQVPQS